MLLVKPSTILRWRREGFRVVRRRRSRPRKGAEARICHQTIELIRRMAIENKTWGAERIRGELLKDVSFLWLVQRRAGTSGRRSCSKCTPVSTMRRATRAR